MADLDDFFAKKDKKKGKTKKFLSSDELMKQLEQTAIKESEPASKKPAKIEEESETTTSATNNEIDEEWKEYEEEKRPDLSNLKLGQLNINDSNENNNNYSGGNDYENENSNNEGDNGENPWNKANSTKGGPKKAPTLPDPAKQTKSTGAYVPPSLARAENAAKSRLNRKNAPDIKNEESFPELGTAKAPEPIRSNKKDGFEEVKHGGKSQSTISGPGSVSLGNAYSSLLDTSDS